MVSDRSLRTALWPVVTGVILALLVGACGQDPRRAPTATESVTEPPPASAAPTPPPATSTAPESPRALAPAACEPPLVIEPARLLAAWPTLIGRHVALDASIERAVDFSEVIVVAGRGGARFSVLMPPDQAWPGRARRTFTVVGSTTVHLHLGGRVALVQLVLDGGCAP